MLIVVHPHSGVPVYRQLMEQIKFHVASGLLAPGDELPSTRELSAELGVNPMTVSKAYSFLERDGVVERRPGRRLVVTALENGEIRGEQLDQVRRSLEQTVTIVRQLGLPGEEALRVFEEMLEDRPHESSGTQAEENE
ncbi:MAG: GntR family transcriptional regulator [bacterium]